MAERGRRSLLVGLLPLGGGLTEHTKVFCDRNKSPRTFAWSVQLRTVSKEDLTLTLRGGRIGVGVRLTHFEVGLHVDERALLQ